MRRRRGSRSSSPKDKEHHSPQGNRPPSPRNRPNSPKGNHNKSPSPKNEYKSIKGNHQLNTLSNNNSQFNFHNENNMAHNEQINSNTLGMGSININNITPIINETAPNINSNITNGLFNNGNGPNSNINQGITHNLPQNNLGNHHNHNQMINPEEVERQRKIINENNRKNQQFNQNLNRPHNFTQQGSVDMYGASNSFNQGGILSQAQRNQSIAHLNQANQVNTTVPTIGQVPSFGGGVNQGVLLTSNSMNRPAVYSGEACCCSIM